MSSTSAQDTSSHVVSPVSMSPRVPLGRVAEFVAHRTISPKKLSALPGRARDGGDALLDGGVHVQPL
jgi:hypothetical protein